MTEYLRTLYAFWASFIIDGQQVQAYEANSVPDGAQLPYITYEVRRAAAFGATNTAAIYWSKGTETESGITANMAAFADAVREAIPEAGTRIDLPTGLLALYRSSGDFISIIEDAEQTEKPGRILGVRVGYDAHFYTT